MVLPGTVVKTLQSIKMQFGNGPVCVFTFKNVSSKMDAKHQSMMLPIIIFLLMHYNVITLRILL